MQSHYKTFRGTEITVLLINVSEVIASNENCNSKNTRFLQKNKLALHHLYNIFSADRYRRNVLSKNDLSETVVLIY